MVQQSEEREDQSGVGRRGGLFLNGSGMKGFHSRVWVRRSRLGCGLDAPNFFTMDIHG